jgi:hypothetical protein
MQVPNGVKFDYQIATMCDMTGAVIYRYTVYQREPKEERLLYGFKETQEEARRIAESYTRIAAEAWKQHHAS